MIISVTDRKISASPNVTDQIRMIAAAHPDMMILREKDMPEEEYGRLASECLRICADSNVKFCINSFVRTAIALGCEYVQIPFAMLADENVKLSGFRELWVSVHSVSEAVYAEKNGATHLIFGNVFETTCKPGLEGKGMKELKEVCDSVKIPVFAIGGIGADNAADVMAAGCEGICVRSFLMSSDDPASSMAELRKSIRSGRI
ncbi:MAG: thiamine phosphate synthase [Methanomassiliicoccaceae archaeon]|nr:thiamine phosphate synthase [Methanomassiliicoccaceae archaeon]